MLRSREPRLNCLTNEVSFTRLAIFNVLWVSKKSFAAALAISPKCIQYSEMEEAIKHTFIVWLYACCVNLLMVCMLCGWYFALVANSVCGNVFLHLLAVMEMVVQPMPKDEIHEELILTHPLLPFAFFKHQKVKIRVE